MDPEKEDHATEFQVIRKPYLNWTAEPNSDVCVEPMLVQQHPQP